jgi:hypothetical protein
MVQRILATVLLLLGAGGCVIIGDPACTGGGASIVVAPGVVVVAVGQSVTPTASDSWCANGHEAHGSPSWSLVQPADSSIVSLDAVTGRITGLRAGQAILMARSSSGATTTITVTVH